MPESGVRYSEINSKVKVEVDGLFDYRILVGNTGLFFVNSNGNWRWHFMPDDYSSPLILKEDLSGNVTKFVKVFGYAFFSFYLWYFNDDNFTRFDRPTEIIVGTNLVMVNFCKSIFGPRYIDSQLSPFQNPSYGDIYNCKILLKSAFEDEYVLQTLESFYYHVKKHPVNMEK